MNLPLSECYWVAPDFLAGEYPGHFEQFQAARRVTALLNAGITLFIDLTEEGELLPYHHLLEEERQAGRDVLHQRFPVTDLSTPSVAHMNAILDAIDLGLQEGRKIYLHCRGGIGRTGTVVGCYLVRRGMSGPQALQQLATWWRQVPKSSRSPRSPETLAQIAFVLNWS